MSQANLKAVVTAEDKASTPISRLTSSIDNLGKSLEKTNQKSAQTASSNAKLAGSVAVGVGAYNALANTLNKVVGFFGSSIKAANEYQSAMVGLATVANAFGHSATQATQAAKSLSQDGLMTINESGTALKNLLASGFSLPQAIKLMNNFKDVAAFNRQGTLEFGQAIVGATIGIKNGNSILVDNIGLTKNLSVILKEAGLSEQDLMRATSDTTVRMALYNGMLKETAAFSGDAQKLTMTFAGAQAVAKIRVTELKQSIGTLLQTAGKPLLETFTRFVSVNRQAIASFSIASVGAIIFGTAILGLVKVGTVVATVIRGLTLTTGALGLALLAISAVIGVVLYKAMDKVQSQISAQNAGLTENVDASQQAAEGTSGLAGAQEDLGKKIAKVNLQIERETRSYKESLAQMVKDHESKVTDLEGQIKDEGSTFAESQAEQADNHQDRVDRIQDQIDREMALGAERNQTLIDGYRQEIEEENQAYNKKVAKEQERHAKKMADMEAELAAERALLQKHADEIATAKDVTLLDEFEKLKRAHDEQMVEYDEQKRDIIASANAAGSGAVGAMQSYSDDMNSVGKLLGSEMGAGMRQALVDSFKDVGITVMKFLYRVADTIKQILGKGAWKLLGKSEFWENPGQAISSSWKQAGINAENDFATSSGRATGGPVVSGRPFMVGERGPELFIPPQSGKIMPNNKLSNSGGDINITIQTQAFAGSEMEMRQFAEKIKQALSDIQMARGMA